MELEIVRSELKSGLTYRLVDTTSVKGLHRSFSRTWIVVLDETVVEALVVELYRRMR